MKNDKEGVILTKGSIYSIKSLESQEHPLETRGTFIGYTAIGSDEAITIEMDESHGELAGKVRLIPIGMLVSIDILTQVEEEQEKESETARYFG